MTVPTEITDGSDAPGSPPDLRDLVLRGFRATHSSAETLAIAIASGSWGVTDTIRRYEEDLDTLDRQVNEGVTGAIVLASETRARELLAYLKLIIDLERISDLLLNVANRLETVGSKLAAEDLKDLGTMASVVTRMLGRVTEAFLQRELDPALRVLKDDAEVDRLRNLIFVRHVDNPEREPRQEGFHLVFMTQTLERSGDHAKNLAEEICHLVTGRSMRHILREHDRPIEHLFLERMRNNPQPAKGSAKTTYPTD